MIIEQRTYELKPGSMGEFLKAYEAEGLAVQGEALGQLLGYCELFRNGNQSVLDCEMYLVTDEVQPDMTGLLITNDIHLVEVGY